MRPFYKYLFCFFAFFSIDINAQNDKKYSGLWSEKQSASTRKNLKDSVKTVYFKIKPKQGLTEKKIGRFIIHNDIRDYRYLEVDKQGRIISEYWDSGSAEEVYLSTIDHQRTYDYTYDEKDWSQKSRCKTALKPYYPVRTNNLLVKLNRVVAINADNVFGDADKVWKNNWEDVYLYIYDKQGRITEEREFNVIRGKAMLNKNRSEKDLFTRKIFAYNSKGQVVNQKIIPGSYGKDMSYTDLGTECGFCDDLQLKYAYDQQGRIIQVIMYSCGEIVAQEDYVYHPTKDYVEMVKCYVSGPGSIANANEKFEKTYNEQGDIIKKEFIPGLGGLGLYGETRYYNYEYDSHNNWIKCNMFLEGKQEGEPTLVAERKIEYYN
ncbi:hypothetical protein [Flavobacterium sp.]|uniref:hypothetical protein n=1 Tax=Flavobacterium sp. TaxID=239 RepID=UPI002C5BD9D8|nr:hypothetical protein [Flavobacterium sp.]HSD06442.1 hypothetical protein [Flavobacterium sp.]